MVRIGRRWQEVGRRLFSDLLPRNDCRSNQLSRRQEVAGGFHYLRTERGTLLHIYRVVGQNLLLPPAAGAFITLSDAALVGCGGRRFRRCEGGPPANLLLPPAGLPAPTGQSTSPSQPRPPRWTRSIPSPYKEACHVAAPLHPAVLDRGDRGPRVPRMDDGRCLAAASRRLRAATGRDCCRGVAWVRVGAVRAPWGKPGAVAGIGGGRHDSVRTVPVVRSCVVVRVIYLVSAYRVRRSTLQRGTG